MRSDMGKPTYTERIGLAKGILRFIESLRAMLIEAGLKPDKLAKTLRQRLGVSVDANDKQERLKAALKRSTNVVATAGRGHVRDRLGLHRRDERWADEGLGVLERPAEGPQRGEDGPETAQYPNTTVSCAGMEAFTLPFIPF